MAEWRHNHPDAKAAAKAYPLPHGFLNSNGFDEGVGHSDNLFASLAAFESRSGRKATSGDFEAFRAAAAPLVAEARRTDRVFDKRILALVGAEGGENKVIFTPGRVLKISQDGDSAGAVVRFTENGKPVVVRGTLPEFIRQIETDNRLAGDDIRLCPRAKSGALGAQAFGEAMLRGMGMESWNVDAGNNGALPSAMRPAFRYLFAASGGIADGGGCSLPEKPISSSCSSYASSRFGGGSGRWG